MKAKLQVKRRRQALHQDRVTLEEKQVDGEGETYGAGRFLGLFFNYYFYRLFSKPLGLHIRCLCVCVRYVCAVWMLANNLQLLLVKREDPWLIVYMLVSNLMFTFLAQALAPCHLKKKVKPIYGVLAHSLVEVSFDSRITNRFEKLSLSCCKNGVVVQTYHYHNLTILIFSKHVFFGWGKSYSSSHIIKQFNILHTFLKLCLFDLCYGRSLFSFQTSSHFLWVDIWSILLHFFKIQPHYPRNELKALCS